MKQVQFVQYTVKTNREGEQEAIFKTSEGEEFRLAVTDSARPLLKQYTDELMARKISSIPDEEAREEKEKSVVAQQLFEYSRSYLRRSNDGDEQEGIHMAAAEEYLALSLMLDRLDRWGVDPLPILERAKEHYRLNFDSTRQTVVRHAITLLSENK